MKPLKKMPLIFTLALVGYLLLSTAPAARAFMTFYHDGFEHLDNLLINKVHAPFWTIHYSFENCGEVDEETQKKYTQIVTKFLQSWLQPLREYTDHPIVNDFRYRLNDDWKEADFGIITTCGETKRSRASVSNTVGIKHYALKLDLTWRWMSSVILHELGHLFGLSDTYVELEDWGKPGLTTGGRDFTVGSQPTSIMNGGTFISTKKMDFPNWDEQIPLQGVVPLGEDDHNGIIWLYKFVYEGLALEDCFFPHYELEEEPRLGCVPKYPLIFALTFHIEHDSVSMIKEDEGLDVNAQDADGLTALHHAILNGYTKVVETLLFRGLFRHRKHTTDVNVKDTAGRTALHHAVLLGLEGVVKALLADKDIKPFLRDKQRRSALDIARENELDRMIELLLAHPLTLPVRPQGKLATTWGALKSGR